MDESYLDFAKNLDHGRMWKVYELLGGSPATLEESRHELGRFVATLYLQFEFTKEFDNMYNGASRAKEFHITSAF